MYDYILEEMADVISQELHVDNAQVLYVLGRYWYDKIAHVWQAQDVLECARRDGKPITERGAVEVLYDVFEHLDSEFGITWTSLQTELEDYRLDFEKLSRDEWREVQGVFKVWREGDSAGVQYGSFPDEVKGNLTRALKSAQGLAMGLRDMPVYVGCVRQSDDKAQPWLTVLAKAGEAEPFITEGGA